MPEMSIGEVSRESGIPASTLRYYEGEGLLPKVGRRGGKRIYPRSILVQISIIELAKAAGFTLAEIKKLVRGFDRATAPGPLWRRLAETKLEEIESQLSQLRIMKQILHAVIACECPRVTDCVNAMKRSRNA